MRDSFIFFRSFWDGIRSLDDQTIARLVKALALYALDEQEPQLSGLENAVFQSWKANIDASERRRANGKLGGRKPMVTESETNGSESENHWLADQKPNKNMNKNKNENKNGECEKEKEKESEPDKRESVERKARFSPPTREEVEDYIFEKGYHVDAVKFISYYQSNGWMVGRNKMKDWKAAIASWERSDKPKLSRVEEVDTW